MLQKESKQIFVTFVNNNHIKYMKERQKAFFMRCKSTIGNENKNKAILYTHIYNV